jgi:hypothetical protein
MEVPTRVLLKLLGYIPILVKVGKQSRKLYFAIWVLLFPAFFFAVAG